MRLFLGSPAVIDDYGQLQELFAPYFKGGWSREQNLHLTLYFFGEVADAAPLIKKLQKVDFSKKEVELEGFGIFGRAAQTLYACAKEDVFSQMHHEAAKLIGAPSNHFLPHVTLMRIKKDLRAKLTECDDMLKLPCSGKILSPVHLYESKLHSDGPIYTVIHSF